MSKLVYLSGAISEISDEDAFTWRLKATRLLAENDIKTIIPRRISSEELKTQGPNYVVRSDLAHIKRSDVVLVELTGPRQLYLGTLMEMPWAVSFEKPVIIWSSWARESAWLAFHATAIYETLEECVDAIKELLL